MGAFRTFVHVYAIASTALRVYLVVLDAQSLHNLKHGDVARELESRKQIADAAGTIRLGDAGIGQELSMLLAALILNAIGVAVSLGWAIYYDLLLGFGLLARLRGKGKVAPADDGKAPGGATGGSSTRQQAWAKEEGAESSSADQQRGGPQGEGTEEEEAGADDVRAVQGVAAAAADEETGEAQAAAQASPSPDSRRSSSSGGKAPPVAASSSSSSEQVDYDDPDNEGERERLEIAATAPAFSVNLIATFLLLICNGSLLAHFTFFGMWCSDSFSDWQGTSAEGSTSAGGFVCESVEEAVRRKRSILISIVLTFATCTWFYTRTFKFQISGLSGGSGDDGIMQKVLQLGGITLFIALLNAASAVFILVTCINDANLQDRKFDQGDFTVDSNQVIGRAGSALVLFSVITGVLQSGWMTWVGLDIKSQMSGEGVSATMIISFILVVTLSITSGALCLKTAVYMKKVLGLNDFWIRYQYVFSIIMLAPWGSVVSMLLCCAPCFCCALFTRD